MWSYHVHVILWCDHSYVYTHTGIFCICLYTQDTCMNVCSKVCFLKLCYYWSKDMKVILSLCIHTSVLSSVFYTDCICGCTHTLPLFLENCLLEKSYIEYAQLYYACGCSLLCLCDNKVYVFFTGNKTHSY